MDLCKQNFIEPTNERPLGWLGDEILGSRHMIKQSVDVAYLIWPFAINIYLFCNSAGVPPGGTSGTV